MNGDGDGVRPEVRTRNVFSFALSANGRQHCFNHTAAACRGTEHTRDGLPSTFGLPRPGVGLGVRSADTTVAAVTGMPGSGRDTRGRKALAFGAAGPLGGQRNLTSL